MWDRSKTLDVKQSIKSKLISSTETGTGIDLANVEAATIVIAPGTITDGTHTPTVEESDSSGSGYTTVAAANLVGTLAAIASSVVQQVGYIGSKRYIRVLSTVTGSPMTGGQYAAFVIRQMKRKQP